jgi:hypothetical protein
MWSRLPDDSLIHDAPFSVTSQYQSMTSALVLNTKSFTLYRLRYGIAVKWLSKRGGEDPGIQFMQI